MTGEIAALVRRHARGGPLLFLGDDQGALDLVRDSTDGAAPAVVYGRGRNVANVRAEVELVDLDIEHDPFPAVDGAFDVVVCSQWLMSMGDIGHALDEAWRVLRPNGLLVVSTTNLSALHNCVLLALGRQPSTIALDGPHPRGFAIHSTTRFLRAGGRFRLVAVRGVGLHPLTSRAVPRPLRTYAHTVVWALTKT